MAERVGLPRRLPYVPVPCEGESFSSWIGRVAEEYGLTRRVVIELLGLEDTSADLSLALRDDQVAVVAAATGIGGERIADMLVTRYVDTVLPAMEYTSDGRVFGWWLSTAWIRNHGSYACVRCLAESSVWKLSWKLPWVTVCLAHRIYLTGFCRACRRPVVTRSRAISQFGCGNAAPTCRTDLRASSKMDFAGDERVRVIAQHLDAAMSVTGLNAAAARLMFNELRVLIQLALYMGTPGMLDATDLPVRQGFERFCRKRDAMVGYGRRASMVEKTYQELRLRPPGPLLMSAALVIAMRLFTAKDESAAIDWFISHCESDSVTRSRWIKLDGYSVYLKSVGHDPNWSLPPRYEGINSAIEDKVKKQRSQQPVSRLPKGVTLAAVGEGLPYLATRTGAAR